jgi:hypothetical protein
MKSALAEKRPIIVKGILESKEGGDGCITHGCDCHRFRARSAVAPCCLVQSLHSASIFQSHPFSGITDDIFLIGSVSPFNLRLWNVTRAGLGSSSHDLLISGYEYVTNPTTIGEETC